MTKQMIKNFFLCLFHKIKIVLIVQKRIFFSNVSKKRETRCSIFHLSQKKNKEGLGKYYIILYYQMNGIKLLSKHTDNTVRDISCQRASWSGRVNFRNGFRTLKKENYFFSPKFLRSFFKNFMRCR